MGQKKLARFAEIETFPNVLIYPEEMQGQWKHHFGNDHPVTLELACGKGDYTLGLARLFPSKNFIGVDVKGNRIWKGARTALDEGLANAAFLRTQIDHIDQYFAPGEVKEIWITFPDPFLRASKAKKRLTHSRFLHLYERILQPGGKIHLKTDSPELYAFTREMIAENNCILEEDLPDVYAEETDDVLNIKTFYEQGHLKAGRTIRYLRFVLPEKLPALPIKEKNNMSLPVPEKEDYYFDNFGRMVFTAAYHLKRGYCCGNGCRHCPYHHENVAGKKKEKPEGKNNAGPGSQGPVL